ncbi:MAG: 50S ribosomal protein L11 methyltransferase [Prevotellaceae bacterium]|jgi:ribosomal protein L11 methyltransferase|nr:50S ribosomal protein L11 methyltransferase [Prevotellaceae bacterium]
MDYYEINLTLSPFSADISEIVVAEFADLGCDSFTDTENGINAYIAKNIFDENKIKSAVANLENITKINYSTTYIEKQNWNVIWESNFEPVVIGDLCTIRAPFHHNLPKTKYEIVIMPKMSFGTGHHATTYLVAEALLNIDVTNLQILDMGCGTGILSILAAMRNAAHVDAIDIDEWAYTNAIENIRENNTEKKVSVILGDVKQINGKSYDLILANINRNIIISDIKYYAQSLKNGGILIISGILTEDISAIETEAKKYKLKKIAEKNRDKWARVVFGI